MIKKTLIAAFTFLVIGLNAQTKNDQLFTAVQNNVADKAEMLLKAGCDVNYFVMGSPDIKVSLLIAAVNSKNTTMAKMLLDYKADVNWKDNLNQSAIMYAALGGNTEMVKLLLSHGANINDSDGKNNNVLQMAKFSQNKELTSFVEAEITKSHK